MTKDLKDTHHEEITEVAHAEENGLLPQFKIETFSSQLFWLFVTLAFIYFVMAKISLPSISKTLRNRKETIDGDLEKAKKMQEEASGVMHNYESELDGARKKSEEMIAEINQKIKENNITKTEKIDEVIRKQRREADSRLASIREENIEKMKPVSIEIAQIIARKLLGVELEAVKVEAGVELFNKEGV